MWNFDVAAVAARLPLGFGDEGGVVKITKLYPNANEHLTLILYSLSRPLGTRISGAQ
jgi:hypothetical protein